MSTLIKVDIITKQAQQWEQLRTLPNLPKEQINNKTIPLTMMKKTNTNT